MRTGQNTSVEAVKGMVEELISEVIEQSLLGAVPGFVSRASGPVTLVEREGHGLALGRTAGRLFLL
jgi:hypothetical protein